jgi:hypothetical protein
MVLRRIHMATRDPFPCADEQPPVRNNYFTGQYMTAADFSTEQEYHRALRRAHNRYLHGHGVVCGLAVEPTHPASDVVVVRPGIAIDCCGREIVLTEPVEADVRTVLDGSAPVVRAYVTVHYGEEPVEHLPVPGGDDESEATRVRELARVDVVSTPPARPSRVAAGGDVRPCPPCADPRIMLAAVDVSQPGPIAGEHIHCDVRTAIGEESPGPSPPPAVDVVERRVARLERTLLAAGTMGVAGWIIARWRRG